MIVIYGNIAKSYEDNGGAGSMSRGNNRGNARIIREQRTAYENMRRSNSFSDRVKWYIGLYRASSGKNNNWKVGSFKAEGKIYEARLTVTERNE
jgi:hypothetical protein